jgi:hypothetical protein
LTVLFVSASFQLERTLKAGEKFGLELMEQRSNIRKFYFIMSIGYALRIPIQFLYGWYFLFVEEWYWRWVLYLVSNPVFELPTIFFCFVMH